MLLSVSDQKVRPTGVTILAILEIISGIAYFGAGSMFATMSGMMGIDVAAYSGAISGGMIALGIASFVMAWGLLKGKSWAWTVTLILTLIGLASNAVSFNVIGIIINAIVLYYLYRPHVKAYFGK